MDEKKSFIQQVVDEDIFIGEKWWDDLRKEIVNILSHIKELEDNIDDPEWCCEKHKAGLVLRIEELEEGIERLRMVDTRHGVKLVDRLERAETRVKELEKELEGLANGWLKKFNDMESGYLTCIEKLHEGIEGYLISYPLASIDELKKLLEEKR